MLNELLHELSMAAAVILIVAFILAAWADHVAAVRSQNEQTFQYA